MSAHDGPKIASDFQVATVGRIERLLQGLGIAAVIKEVQGRTESYATITVQHDPGTRLEIFVYEEEVGYWLDEEWNIWETQDYHSLEDLAEAFLGKIRQDLKGLGPAQDQASVTSQAPE